jgi:emp24/gp25L/p24 family/GOLD
MARIIADWWRPAAVLVVVAGVAVYAFQTCAPAASPSRSTRGTAVGEAVPNGQLPSLTATPRLVWFQREPYGPVTIGPRMSNIVEVPRLEAGTQVRAVVTVAFNRGVSNLFGTPDIDVRVEGPSGMVTQVGRARNGTQLAFQTPADGEYRIILSNSYSQVNAKQVSLQFLQP